MKNLPLRAAALALIAFYSALAPVQAAPRNGGVYRATLATPLTQPRQAVIREALWKCSGDSCVARVEGSRDVFTCAKVASKFGPIAKFSTPAGDMSAEDLAQCNASGL